MPKALDLKSVVEGVASPNVRLNFIQKHFLTGNSGREYHILLLKTSNSRSY